VDLSSFQVADLLCDPGADQLVDVQAQASSRSCDPRRIHDAVTKIESYCQIDSVPFSVHGPLFGAVAPKQVYLC